MKKLTGYFKKVIILGSLILLMQWCISSINGKENDYREYQWYMKEIYDAWGIMKTYDTEVVIAVIDSGIDLYHEDLQGMYKAGYNFRENNEWLMDIDNHGTSISGLIAANSCDTYGIDGISGNYPIKILPIRISGIGSDAKSSDVVRALKYAIDKEVDIINLSFSSSMHSEAENDLIQEAIDKGIVVVAAAGNRGIEETVYPASYDGVITVGASDANKGLWEYSNYGASVDFVAPGVDLLLPSIGNNYELFSGTSYAAAYTSGIIGLIKCIRPDYGYDEVYKLLKETAEDLGESGVDDYYGYGLIRPEVAIGKLTENYLTKVIEVKKVAINQQLMMIKKGETRNLPQFEVLPKGISTANFDYEAVDDAVVRIHSNKVTGLNKGTTKAVLKGFDGTVYGQLNIIVYEELETFDTAYNVSINKEWGVKLSMPLGHTELNDHIQIYDAYGEAIPIEWTLSEDLTEIRIKPKNKYDYDSKYILVIKGLLDSHLNRMKEDVVKVFYTEKSAKTKTKAYVQEAGKDYLVLQWDDSNEVEYFHIYYSDQYDGGYYPFLDKHGYKKKFPMIPIYGVKNSRLPLNKVMYYKVSPIYRIQNPYTTSELIASNSAVGKTVEDEDLNMIITQERDSMDWIENNLIQFYWMKSDTTTTVVTCSGITVYNRVPARVNISYEIDMKEIVSVKILVNGAEVSYSELLHDTTD